MFPNKMPDKFSGEISEANEKALETPYDDPQALGPFVAGTDGFRKFVLSGRTFKWVYTFRKSLSGDVHTLAIVGSQLKHSVAAGGIPVLTAGSGVFWANGKIAKLNNDTGHYQTTVESLGLVRDAWLATGIVDAVEFKERTDFGQALQAMGKQKKGFF
jgi:hypothetical protein